MWVAFSDIGQARDYGVVGLIEHTIEGENIDRATDHYVLRYIRRMPLGTKYGELLTQLDRLMNLPETHGDCQGVIDGGGVGRAVMEMARERNMSIRAITATSGNSAGYNDIGITVPKIDLVQGLLISLELDRFHVATGLPENSNDEQRRDFEDTMKHLRDEMKDLKIKVNSRTKHVGIEAGHEEIHDDMIMGICIGLYWIKKYAPTIENSPIQEKEEPFNELTFGMK